MHEVLVFPFDTSALRPLFFTEEWFTIIEFTLREAQRHGMHVWLFNDDFFPSGRAGGFVANGGTVGDHVYEPRPDLRTKAIGHVPMTVEGGGPVLLATRGLSVVDGRLVVDAAVRDGITVLREGLEWTDYDVVAKVRVERGTAGVMVRSRDERNGMLADLRPNGAVDIWRQVDGAFTHLRFGTPHPGFDPAVDHELRVSVRGDTIQATVDGVAQPPVVDATHAAGRVGVRATATQRSSWDSLTVVDADGQVLYTEQFDSIAALDAFDLPVTNIPLAAASARPEGSTDVTEIVDLTEIARGDGVWDAPPGRWRVDLFTVRTPTRGGLARNYLDLLDDEAVGLYLDIVPGEYLRRFPWAVGGVLRGFADDEPFIASSQPHYNMVPWSPSLDDELSDLGTTPGIALSTVHYDLGPEGRRLRGVFWRAVSNRFAAAYYRRQGEWMADHGVRFISNPLYDEYGPGQQLRSTGNLNTVNQWAQIPGTDLVYDHYDLGYQRTLSRWAASTAHQLGLDRVYVEAMGAMGWHVTPALTREVVGAFAARGVNYTLLHCVFSNADDIFFPPPFQPVNPWWNVATPMTEWIGRLMEACRATAPAHTALLQPQRAFESYQHTTAMAAIDAAFLTTSNALEDVQVDFDYVDEGALDTDPALIARARPEGPKLALGQQKYRIVVVPETPILSLGAVRMLTKVAQAGGTVIVIGELPAYEARGDHGGLRTALKELFSGDRPAIRAAAPPAAAAAVVVAGGAAARLDPPRDDVRVLRLAQGEEQGFVVANENGAALDLTVAFPATGVPEIWNPDTGSVSAPSVWESGSGETSVSLRMGPKATLLVVFRVGKEPPHAVSATAPVERVLIEGHHANATVRVTAPGEVTVVATDGRRRYRGSVTTTDPLEPIPLDGDWVFHFDREGAPSTPRPLGSWTTVDSRYSGSAWYERTFVFEAVNDRQWILDLGEVREVAEIAVNGTSVGSRLWPPYRLDVTSALRPGENSVRVRVTNTGANVRGQALPSGLLGPVFLRQEQLVDVPLIPE